MKGFGFDNQPAVLVQNAVAEIQPHAFDERGENFNGEQIIVARGRFVAQPRLDDGKNKVRVLQFQNGAAEGAEKFAARGLEQIKIARMINVVADGAFGVADAMVMDESFRHARRLGGAGKNSNG